MKVVVAKFKSPQRIAIGKFEARDVSDLRPERDGLRLDVKGDWVQVLDGARTYLIHGSCFAFLETVG